MKACWTKIAEPYPKRLSAFLAWSVCTQLGYTARKATSLACRCNHRRIGEAKNPGPRRAANVTGRDPSGLDAVQMIRPETQAIGNRQWSDFVNWARMQLGDEIIESLWIAPGLLGQMLASYGRFMYECGKPLFNFRHLVVFAQREHVGVRGHLQKAWDTIARWEELEPVEHRRPIPVAMLQAMVSLACFWGWWRVAAVLVTAFYGCCRPGEVLKACRGQLVFPKDVGQSSGPVFFRIQKPKPGRRGIGRVQHTKIVDLNACKFLSFVLEDCAGEVFVYPGSASSFRTRWEKLLRGLKIPLNSGLTPAGLRAGGTVELYRQGTPIADILWALRLRNIETLQHYLQEISTQITMVDLPKPCKDLVASFSIFFNSLVSIHQR